MHFDIRYPIGALLITYGALLAAHGVIVHATVLDINVNLYWGGVMVAFGLGALYLARRGTIRR